MKRTTAPAIPGTRTTDNVSDSRHPRRPAGSEQYSFGQPVRQAQHPLAHRYPRQHCVDEAGCSFGHAASHFLFEPIEFLEKLAAIIPPARGQLAALSRPPRPACSVALTGGELRPPGP